MVKKVIFCISLAIILFYIGAIVFMIAGVFDSKKMGSNKIDYTAQNSPYAVVTSYDSQKHLLAITVVHAKSGEEVVGISDKGSSDKIADRYEVKETTSSLIFILYDAENMVINQYEFDTDTGNWKDLSPS
jgi:ABC-type Na+ efflux pump permease subunit